MKKLILMGLFCLILPFSGQAAKSEPTNKPEINRPLIRILNSDDFTVKKDFFPFNPESPAEGLNIATADLNNDGDYEIIVATGRNEKPWVKIFNNQGELVNEFLAYDEKIKSGFKAIASDLYNDGTLKIITIPNKGQSAQIKIFNTQGQLYIAFQAFNEKTLGGGSVAVGDINNDGQNEIIVGAGADMDPIVRIFNNYGHYLNEFPVLPPTYRNGINVLVADTNNDNKAEIITAPNYGHEPKVEIFTEKGVLVQEFLAYAPNFIGGVNLSSSDINNDGQREILTGPGPTGGSHLRAFNANGQLQIDPKIFVFENFRGGISIADGNLNKSGQKEILVATQSTSLKKVIAIDLSKQKLYAYSNGILEKEFWVSTGIWKYPTPTGTYKINRKILKKTMSGNYGPNNPDNYSLPNVPNVMYFYKNFAIHGAYWHFKFGTRVSHGCVNLRLDDAKWLYNWAPIDTPVNIYSSKK